MSREKPKVREHKTKLLDYLKDLKTEEKKVDFAARVGISWGGMQQIAYGCRPCKVQYAVRIDKETGGRVTMNYMLPNVDWGYVAKVIPDRIGSLEEES